ncbi:MAG: glucose 1-dehydrogenase [Deinococcus sp.]|nr:glucose 1-dehydrogenase [Deinococcus sp.]
MRLKDQVAIVTGGARGIGRGIAQRFAAEGAQLVIADLDPADQVVRQIVAEGGQALSMPTDVSDRKQVDAMVAQVLQRFGRIDVLVNNAGITGGNGLFHEMTLDTWRRVLDVNLGGVFHCGQAVARAMIEGKTRGRIVNVGSINSFAAEAQAGAYAAAKGGVLLLTKAMAVDLAPYGIVVNCLAPGPILHEKTAPQFQAEPLLSGISKSLPLGRPGTVEEVAAAALFLASGECPFLTGTSLLVDGGQLAYLRFD